MEINELYLIAALTFCSTASFAWLLVDTISDFLKEYRDIFKESAQADLADMFMFVDPHRLFLFNILGIAIAPLFTWLLSHDLLAVFISVGVMVIVPRLIYNRMRRKRLEKFERQLPDAFMMLSGSLQAGASLNMALEALVSEQPAPVSQEFGLMVKQHRIGVDFDVALDNMEARLPIPDFQIAISAIRISREVGGNLVQVIETLADTLRRKSVMEGKIDSLTAQGRLQGIVMTGLPILLGLLLMKLEPEAMGMLFTTPVGWATLVIIVVMEFLGYMSIRKITSIDV